VSIGPDSSVEERGLAAFSLAQEIARIMPGWVARPPGERYWTARIERPADGGAISITVGDRLARGRVVFRPSWPTYSDGRQYSTPARPCKHPKPFADARSCSDCMHHSWKRWEITVAETRTPQAMVREIERRLLVDYDVSMREARVQMAAVERRADEADLVGQRLAGIVEGIVRTRSYRTGEKVEVSTPHTRAVYRLEVSPGYEDTPVRVAFQLHGLAPEVAAQVLAIIQDAERAELARKVRVAPPEPAAAEDEDEEEGRGERRSA
jgi:hypothetical protein